MTIGSFASRALIALVVLNAATAVTALLISSDKQIGDFEGRVFLTTLAVSMAALSVLPCAIAWERESLGPARVVAPIGIAAAGVTLVALVIAIWTTGNADDFDRATATAACVSLGLALICLLSLAGLKPSLQWLQYLAYALTAVLAAELIGLIWSDDPGDDSFRILTATTVLLVAASVLVPVLQRASGPEESGIITPSFCPNCGERLQGSGAPVTCAACGVRFEVVFE